MRRITNSYRFKLILQGAFSSYSSDGLGTMENDFTIYLKDGDTYEGKRGYTVSWSTDEDDEDDILKISETYHPSTIGNDEGLNFFEKAAAVLFQGGVVDHVEIGWHEIDDIRIDD